MPMIMCLAMTAFADDNLPSSTRENGGGGGVEERQVGRESVEKKGVGVGWDGGGGGWGSVFV